MEHILSILKNDTVIQGIGFVGLFLSVLGIQNQSYNRLAMFKILTELIFGFQLLLLGAYTGMATNFAACFTNSVYRARIRRGKSTLPFQILFGILFVVLGIVTWHGPLSLLVILAKLLSTVSMGIHHTKVIRIINLIVSPMWLIYDIAVFSVGGAINDVLLILSVTVAIIRIDILKK